MVEVPVVWLSKSSAKGSAVIAAQSGPNEFYRNEDILDFLQKNMKHCQLEARSFRLRSSSIPTNHPLVKACLQKGLKPFGSPTLSDQALMPFPSLKIGPGNSARSHSADEYIGLDEIAQAIDIYRDMIMGA